MGDREGGFLAAWQLERTADGRGGGGGVGVGGWSTS